MSCDQKPPVPSSIHSEAMLGGGHSHGTQAECRLNLQDQGVSAVYAKSDAIRRP